LQTCYNTYSALFEDTPETFALMEKAAALFFVDLNNIYIDYVILQICRIADNDIRSLTVHGMNTLLHKSNLYSQDIDDLSNELTKHKDRLNIARNKVIGHSDTKTILSKMTLGQHTHAESVEFFANLQKYMDLVGIAIGIGPADYQMTGGPGDVYDLLKLLRLGLKHEEI